MDKCIPRICVKYDKLRTKQKNRIHFYGQTWNACIKHDTAQCSSINHLSFERENRRISIAVPAASDRLRPTFYLKNVLRSVAQLLRIVRINVARARIRFEAINKNVKKKKKNYVRIEML